MASKKVLMLAKKRNPNPCDERNMWIAIIAVILVVVIAIFLTQEELTF